MADHSHPDYRTGLIEVVAYSAANSRAYLSAVFAAYRSGQVVLALPHGQERRTVPGTKILERKVFDDDDGWFSDKLILDTRDVPAQISLSSGTTGRPKAILLSHRALSDVVQRINVAMQVDDSIREYVGVPVTFSFGFGRCRAVAAAGGQSYLPQHGFDPNEIRRMLDEGEINAISAVPTLWRIVLANPDIIGDAGRRVKWIEIGSQYMSAEEKAAMKELFPQATIVQHYGLTEASRSTLLDISSSAHALLESVGTPTGDTEIEIKDDLIRVRGPHLAEGLVTGAGVKKIVDEDGWLTTSDRGELRDGHLFYLGRADELINSGGLKIDPTLFEQRLIADLHQTVELGVGRTTDPMRGEKVLIVYSGSEDLVADIEKAAKSVGGDFGLTGTGAVEIRRVAEIPKTATGKVQRGLLQDLEAIGDAQTLGGSADDTSADQRDRLIALWQEVLGVERVETDQSFYDLGGDSLSALTLIIRMETLGLAPDLARGIFDGRTIDDIAGKGQTAPASNQLTHEAAELQKIWAEVLGVDQVATDQSFYDLGGDSLSALTLIMRMEAAGLSTEIARGIFDGKSIDGILGKSETPDINNLQSSLESDTMERVPVSEGTAELRKLWSEVLGVDDIPLDKSFYDLGGDSLSALTVIMRMEALGLAPDVARSIFDGKTIQQIVGSTATEPNEDAGSSEEIERLKVIWSEVLGVETISIDQSFYDLGGDSLSALTLIMRMEAQGMSAEIARRIFDGKTIRDLVGGANVAPAPKPIERSPVATPKADATPLASPTAPTAPSLSLSDTMNAVHATRGLLVLWVIVVHWLPGVLGRLTPNAEEIYQSLIPFLRFGTPGFAMVFGVGIGALGITQYMRNKEQFKKSSQFNTRLIVAGVLVFAAFKFLSRWINGTIDPDMLPSILFYSAISYYAIAMLALPAIMRVVTVGPNRLLTIAATFVGCLIIHDMMQTWVAPLELSGFAELGKILLSAKYGFFRMTSFVMVGVALGWIMRQNHGQPGMARDFCVAGIVTISLGFAVLWQARPETMFDNFSLVEPWHLTIYSGVLMTLISGFCVLNREGSKGISKPFRLLNAFAIASGILALPMFVGHGIVIPFKNILAGLGAPEPIALSVALAAFLIPVGFGYSRLMRFLYR
ncbi:Acyl-CoA synthetase (AMP-forming)/AMP-acid ligase II [Cognatiyoonia sediminum]|uniref:Acyl-CoA synthetase (AMP-forming)/AMP-acid ligase II n=1 Tax=Cognatiyoonia sediminum TaxID=1508389 RepID=A0A1M5QX61_9RHOB|nr:phosphopantetheine-binding protein [Cognatiyoonia sediminum]SHH18340.1 Acyl-CoA synthetase (AMP-forming)/AMP-acid ligase II [Cognatiyoonia sediminum]